MAHRTRSLVTTAVLAAALAGCGNSIDPPEAAAPATEPEPVETDPTDVDRDPAEDSAEGSSTPPTQTPSASGDAGSGTSESSGTSGSGGSNSGAGVATSSGTGNASAATSGPIELVETSFDIALAESNGNEEPLTVEVPSPGTYTFSVTNSSDIPHALEVDGHGVHASTSTIPPGKTATLQVDLPQAGQYDLYCPVANHKQLGMDGSVVVQSG